MECVYVCVCVCERERERDNRRKADKKTSVDSLCDGGGEYVRELHNLIKKVFLLHLVKLLSKVFFNYHLQTKKFVLH